MEQKMILVGVGVMVLKDGKILLGKRKNAHGAGDYATPGGKLEYGESFEECARRETREECGLEIKNIRFLNVANVLRFAPKHYVHVGLVAEWVSGEPVVVEPEKCEEWNWYDLDNLPENIFYQSELGIESYKTGKNFFEYEQNKS